MAPVCSRLYMAAVVARHAVTALLFLGVFAPHGYEQARALVAVRRVMPLSAWAGVFFAVAAVGVFAIRTACRHAGAVALGLSIVLSLVLAACFGLAAAVASSAAPFGAVSFGFLAVKDCIELSRPSEPGRVRGA